MAMDAKERKKMTIRIVAAVMVILILGLGAILIFSSDEPEAAPQNLGPSDSMIPSDPANIGDDINTGSLVSQTSAITFEDGQTTQTVTLLASGSPIQINSFAVQPDAASAITVTSVDCPSAPQPLAAGTSCSINVAWNGVEAVSSFIDIDASTVSTDGIGTSVSLAIPVTAQGGTGISGLPTEGGIVDASAPAIVDSTTSIPSQAAPQVPVEAAPAGPSVREQQRNAYLNARRSGTLAGLGNGQLNPSARSAYAGWDNIGAGGRTSSYPTDMTRVITPDKPITAVISVPIDTRNPVTAVAMVDRDVYGNNGRTVVIPRGSKLIGTPGASDNRVGIAWRQLIRPDGTRFVFEGQSGDQMGRGGVPGRVNERLLERYGYSLLPNIVGAGITAALGGNETNNTVINGTTQTRDAKSVAAEILSGPLNQIAQDIYQRKSNIPIQISVPAGTRITVWSIDDLRLKPLGEKNTASNQQTQNQNQQGRQGTPINFPTSNGSTNPPQNGSTNNGTSYQQNSGSEGNTDLGNYGVGTIDENGNYIAPGSRAPAPSTAPLNR